MGDLEEAKRLLGEAQEKAREHIEDGTHCTSSWLVQDIYKILTVVIPMLDNMEEEALCDPAHFGIVTYGPHRVDVMVRCVVCDDGVPYKFFDTEEEWQDFRKEIVPPSKLKRRYDPETDEFIEFPAEEPTGYHAERSGQQPSMRRCQPTDEIVRHTGFSNEDLVADMKAREDAMKKDEDLKSPSLVEYPQGNWEPSNEPCPRCGDKMEFLNGNLPRYHCERCNYDLEV